MKQHNSQVSDTSTIENCTSNDNIIFYESHMTINYVNYLFKCYKCYSIRNV